MGLDFNYVVMYKKLPVKNQKILLKFWISRSYLENIISRQIAFSLIRIIMYTFILTKSRLISEQRTTLMKIIQLQYILPNLKEKSGVLEMREYDEDTQNVTFKENG